MKIVIQAATGALLLLAAQSVAQATDDRIYYGSRAGMHLTAVSRSGIGTANAVIRVKLTPEDAKAVKIADRVAGNCTTRTWTDMYGGRYAFLGVAKKSADSIADYAIKDLATGDLLDGSSASGYDVELTIFRQLCPGLAK